MGENKRVKKLLSDPDYLTTLLTAIVKKFEGEIRISQEEMESVTTKDLIALYYDIKSNEVVVSVYFPFHQINDEDVN